MPRGIQNEILYYNSSIDKPLEEIWEMIQAYTGECFPDEPDDMHERTDFIVLIPPLNYEGKFVKGLYMSQGVECIQHKYPEHKKLFIPMAYSMWSSYPWSYNADIYLTSYKYREREEWFKKRYPEKADKIFINRQDADFTHEYAIAPYPDINKDIDVISIARLDKVKNLPLLVEALKIHNQKYGYILRMILITGQTKDTFNEKQSAIIQEMADTAGGFEELKKYIKFEGKVNYGKDLSIFLSRSKCAVLSSIYEGKNRMINEALCCNVPVVAFKQLCTYTKGEDEIFPENAGIYADEFTAESLADALHYMVKNYKKFTPRRSYLSSNGRLNFLNKCIDAIPYYKENLPEYTEGRIQDNLWLDLAIQANYQISLRDFLYGMNIRLQHTRFKDNILSSMEFYYKKFNLR